ncbi:pseudouridylate synthase 1 homolog [Diabrotica virgifera virgifera]|uniref:Pseudouridine synthase I TruA alpha/beta domain-containing protein n=1 Tax=Diabrotica virgifera virgifera TaxID=50390 RepID=A0ABM5KDU1_DIAVI|nr:pseudouridylate synthase 1 homolog [Diabrotica virgifera virgifera]
MLFRITKNISRFFSQADFLSKGPQLPITSIFPSMEPKPFKKNKYDGRTKKRQWEERRRDKGESLRETPEDPKRVKLDEDQEMEKDKIKRRKFCLLLGYSGNNYFGMQRNPNTKTIEEDLLNALFKTHLITEDCYQQVQNMQFQRAARTDKGVSAARQVVSLKLKENIDLNQINAELPEVIRVFNYKRVTKGFNSKSQCDGRSYIYLIPTVAFAPHDKEVSQKDFRLDDETFTKINTILENYLGTKNFHNYTSKKKHNDPSANRYMKSFVCEKPFIRKEVEFAILKVHGQSFMLHQIRKMVGCLLAIIRGLATEDIIKESFKSDKVIIPRAPGLGLVLEYVHYDRYNNRYGADGVHETLTWDEVEDKVQKFKEEYIFPTIIDKEVEEECMINWVNNKLSKHSYDKEEENESDEEFAGGDDDNDESEQSVKECKSNENKIENTN